MSKDGGLPPLAQKIRSTTWFPVLVDEILMAILSSPGDSFGFKARPKLEAGIVALLAGLGLGRRTPNAIATSFALDPLWTATVGRSFGQRELSRLMVVLATLGREPLRRALLASAMDGQTELQIDLDSSLLALHGKQEGGAYNGHYRGSISASPGEQDRAQRAIDGEFGYHVGWGVDVRTDRIAALWLNPGNEHTSQGQDEQLTWILDQGTKVSLARFDAGLIGPKLLQAMEGRVDAFVCRIRPNPTLWATLRSLSDPLEPEGPYFAGARSYDEIRYAAESWDQEQRVVVKFQVPDEEKVQKKAQAKGPAKAQKQCAPALFAERFYFVTSLAEAPAQVVRTYQQRGESERVFGEFAQTFEPPSIAAHARLPVAALLEMESPMRPVRPLPARVRDMALRVPCVFKKIGQRLRLIVCPDLLEPTWFPVLMRT
jgi:hypothetical protein